MFLLKAHRPEKFRERYDVDVTSDGAAIDKAFEASLEKAYGKGSID